MIILSIYINILMKVISLIVKLAAIIWVFLINKIPNNVFLSDVAAFEGILIAISIPLSLNVVSRATDRYNDQEISQIFTKEHIYKFQKIFLLINIGITIFLRFLDIKDQLILWLIFIMLLISIYVFYKFIKLVEQYSSNTDKLLLNRFKSDVEKILKK